MEERLEKLEEKLKSEGVYAAIVYGSHAREEDYNDIDLAVFTDQEILELSGSLPEIFDIHRFQDLPLYIKNRVLEEKEILFCTDKDCFYDQVLETVREYESFNPRFKEYHEGVKSRG